MLVTRVLGDCPSCGGKQRFGNVSVGQNSVLRGCMSCTYRTRVWLPDIRKKIIYLDQFFFSSAFREHDARFVEAAQLIRHLSELQLLVAPFSSVHEEETHQWQGHGGRNKDDLMEFIKATSRGHEFNPAYEVERTQIVRAFRVFLADAPDTFQLQDGDATDDDLHNWDDYYRIDVGRYMGDIDLIRGLKRESVEALVDLFPDWRQSRNAYDEDVELEIQASAKGYIDSFIQYATRLAQGDYAALLDSPIMSMVVQLLLHCLPDDMTPEDRLTRIGAFFSSPHFRQVPYQWLSARIFASLKDMVRRGAYQSRENTIKRLSGFFKDVQHIATYAPYCDAFVMDQPMASLVADPRIDLQARYSVHVFSLNNWGALFEWLSSLERAMSPEHRAGVEAAYP